MGVVVTLPSRVREALTEACTTGTTLSKVYKTCGGEDKRSGQHAVFVSIGISLMKCYTGELEGNVSKMSNKLLINEPLTQVLMHGYYYYYSQ